MFFTIFVFFNVNKKHEKYLKICISTASNFNDFSVFFLNRNIVFYALVIKN